MFLETSLTGTPKVTMEALAITGPWCTPEATKLFPCSAVCWRLSLSWAAAALILSILAWTPASIIGLFTDSVFCLTSASFFPTSLSSSRWSFPYLSFLSFSLCCLSSLAFPSSLRCLSSLAFLSLSRWSFASRSFLYLLSLMGWGIVGLSGTEGAAPTLHISRKKGSFLRPLNVRDFV